MEEEAIKGGGLEWKANRDAKSLFATLFCVLASLIMVVVLFLWNIWSGSGLAADKPSKSSSEQHHMNWAFCVGVLTIMLGFLFLAVGIPLLADLVIKSSQQFQIKQEFTNTHQGEGKLKTICLISRIVVSVIAMLMLAWAINTGVRLATDNRRRDGKYYPLTSPVGIVTIIFGFTYSVIGLFIIAELAVELAKHWQTKPKTEKEKQINMHQVCNIDVKFFV